MIVTTDLDEIENEDDENRPRRGCGAAREMT